MHRIFADLESVKSDTPILSREAKDHLKVIRPKSGEEIELFDGKGSSRLFVYSNNALVPSAEVVFRPSPPLVTLFACVTKGQRWDWTIQKATELGVTRIIPVISKRTIVRISHEESALKVSRWHKIACEAARQSAANWVPEILPPISFDESLDLVRLTECFVGALLDSPPEPILKALSKRKGACSPAVFVGPEGDFTPEEMEKLLSVAIPVSLGSTILRAETAAIYALGAVKAYLDAEAFHCANR
jgi:16S rRNA (uracil1498-N3)-methyltransferase